MAHMRRLWERMIAMYDHKWASSRGLSPQDADGTPTITGETWAKGLAGLSGDQLAAGLRACLTRADEWPPVLAEFRALCLSIPSVTQVQLEFRGLLPASPLGLLVWQTIDSERWRMADPDKRERLIAASYDLAREHVMQGGELPALAAAALEPAKHVKPAPNPEAKARAIAEAEEMLRLDRARLAEAEAERERLAAASGKMQAAGPDA